MYLAKKIHPPRLPFIIAGAGPGSFIGPCAHIPNALATGAFELIGGAPSRNQDFCDEFAENYEVDPDFVCPDLKEAILTAQQFDRNPVVFITTPTDVHFDQIVLSAEQAARAIVVDKPAVTSYSEFRVVEEAFGSCDLPAYVTFNHTFNGAVRAIGEICKNLGPDEIQSVDSFFLQGWLESDPKIRQSDWRLRHPWCGLLDIGTHASQLAETVLGSQIHSVLSSKLGTAGKHGKKVFDNGSAVAEFGNGVRATIQFHQALPGHADDIGIVVRLKDGRALMWRMEWGPETLFVGDSAANIDDPGVWKRHLRGASPLFSDTVNAQFSLNPPGHIQGWSDMWRLLFLAIAGDIHRRSGFLASSDLIPQMSIEPPTLFGAGRSTILFAESAVRSHLEKRAVELSEIVNG